MASNVYPSRAAERVLWKEEFTNAAMVHRNGGTLVGATAPVIKDGAHLVNTDQGVIYPLGDKLATPAITVVFRFNPDFDISDTATLVWFLDTDDASYRVARYADDTLHVTMGGVLFGAPAISTFQAYWKVGEVNYLTIANDGASKFMWCNGHLFNTGALAYVPSHTAATIYLGTRNNLTSSFSGTMLDVSFHGLAFTQADVDAIQDGSLWTYQQRSSLYLDMKEATAQAGTIRGSTELLTDGDMEAVGTAAWPLWNAAIVTKEPGSPGGVGVQVLRVAFNGSANPGTQQVATVVGKRYRARGWGQGDGTFTPRLYIGGGITAWTGSATEWRWFDVTFVANSTSIYLHSNANAAGWAEFDDVSVVETDELLNDARMEATGVGEWAVGSGALLSKEGDPYEGLQCLRITKDAATQDWTSQNVTDINRLYHVVGVARGDGTIAPSVGNSTTYQWAGTISTAWQPFDFWWIDPSGSGLYLYAAAGGGAGNFVEFDAVSVRPVLSRTLDKSKHGRVCLLGDGFTAASIPDFQAPGFRLDGTANYLSMPNAAGIFGTIGQTIAVVIRPGFPIVDGINHYILDSTDGARYRFLKANDDKLYVYMGNTQFPAIATAVLVQHWRTNGVNMLVVASESGDTSMWLNNNLILDSDTTVWTPSDPAEIFLGTIHSGGGYFDGEYDGFMTWPEKLPSLAVRDLMLQLLGGV